jgi:hypothetical protein
MPRAGEVDAAYLDALAAPVDLLHAEGIYVLLDMHQDVRARCFCCDGAPEWAIRDEGEPFTPQAQWFLNDFLPAVKRSFDLFRAGDRGAHPDLQVHFAAAWQAVARRFRGHPGVIGYDQFNEPSPGSKTDVGERLGRPNTDGPSPAFDREDLFPCISASSTRSGSRMPTGGSSWSRATAPRATACRATTRRCTIPGRGTRGSSTPRAFTRWPANATRATSRIATTPSRAGRARVPRNSRGRRRPWCSASGASIGPSPGPTSAVAT